jgi:HPr kinase/phosphorylase
VNHSTVGRVLVHATAIIPGSASLPFGAPVESGVLLLGDSSAGKSDVALRLIAMGSRLLADDRTALSAESGRLYAESVGAAHGHIEVRGIGIVKIPAARRVPVLFCVRLTQDAPPRLPEPEFFHPDGLQISAAPRLFRLHGFEASTPAKIAAAAAAIQSDSLLPGDGSFL